MLSNYFTCSSSYWQFLPPWFERGPASVLGYTSLNNGITVWIRSLDPFYMVSYYINWDKTHGETVHGTKNWVGLKTKWCLGRDCCLAALWAPFGWSESRLSLCRPWDKGYQYLWYKNHLYSTKELFLIFNDILTARCRKCWHKTDTYSRELQILNQWKSQWIQLYNY